MRRPSEVVQNLVGKIDDLGGRCLKVYQDFSDEDPSDFEITYLPRLAWSAGVAGLDAPLGLLSNCLETFVSIPLYLWENKRFGDNGKNPGWRHNPNDLKEDY